MKVFSLSNRFYYREFPDLKNTVLHDLDVYNRVLHKAYKCLYDRAYKGATFKDSELHQLLKKQFHLNDYIPLSAVHEAKALLKANAALNKKLIRKTDKRMNRIGMKIREKETELEKVICEKEKMIRKTKLHGTAEKDYLYEETVIDPKIKNLKNQIKLLKYRLTGEKQKKERFMEKPKSVCFGGRKNLKHDTDTYRYNRRKRILICGRRQGKYGNNLFKYHIDEGVLVYRGIEQEVKLPVVFHKHREHIERAVRMKHNTPGKAIAYELYDHGEYFIIRAIAEYPDEPVTPSDRGSIGMDINRDHIALAEIDRKGNLVKAWRLPVKERGARNQREYERYVAVKRIVEECVGRKKNLVMESLDFERKKEESLYGNRKYNRMLGAFAYKELEEKIERKCRKKGVYLRKVDPRDTSQIGKLKYAKRLGLSIHHSAAYVIARRGEGYRERIPKEYHEYREWREVIRDLGKATLEECQRTPYLSLFR